MLQSRERLIKGFGGLSSACLSIGLPRRLNFFFGQAGSYIPWAAARQVHNDIVPGMRDASCWSPVRPLEVDRDLTLAMVLASLLTCTLARSQEPVIRVES